MLIGPSHQIFRRDRVSRGGGVAIILKSTFSATLLPQIDEHESLFLKVNCWGHILTVCTAYRSPSSPSQYLSSLYRYMSSLVHKKIIMAGDFNLPLIDWSRKNVTDLLDCPLVDIMLACDLQQVVRTITHEHGDSGSIIDLVFVSNAFTEYELSLEPGVSDHKIVLLTCDFDKCVPNRPVLKTIKDFTRADDQSVLDRLWELVDNISDTDPRTLWETFKKTVKDCIDKHVPLRRIKSRRKSPWIDRNVIHLKRRLKRARKKQVVSVQQIQTLQTELSTALATSRDKYFGITLPNFIKESPEKFWRYLASKSGKLEQIQHNDSLITDARLVADKANDYFHSVFSAPHDDSYPLVPTACPPEDFICQNGVLSLLVSVRDKSSSGPDGIPNAFLRRYAEPISHILTEIFRLSLASAILPYDWLVARILATHKKGDRLRIENYRPISLTSTCCKLMEHIVAHYITDFLERNGLLSEFQHGFRKGLSTHTQLIATVHEIASALDSASQIDLVFLDFSKAFDRVPHGKLIGKLLNIGIPDFLVNWIKSYLSNRTQYVEISGCSSGALPVLSGVPQGSVLGPILFLIYVNDITSIVSSDVQIRLFADDCIIFRKITCTEDQIFLNDSLTRVGQWCTSWSMKLNSDKTVLLRITNKREPLKFSYCIDGVTVKENPEYKYLGVTITNTLSWSKHIENTCAAAMRRLGFIRHKLKAAPTEAKLLAYKTLVLPKLEYANIVWDPFSKKDKQKLEMVQRRAVRFIFNKYRSTDSPSSLMVQNGISTLEQRRKLARLKFLFSLFHGHLKLNANPYVKPFLPRASRHRHSHNLLPYKARTNLFKYSFFPRTIADWNALPSSVFSARTAAAFSAKVFAALE